MIVAIDGPAGTGKGTIASLISKRLNFTYIDTGAMYRCVALQMIRDGVGINDDIEKIKEILNKVKITFKNIDGKQHVFLNGEDVSDLIRTPEINEIVSPVSAIKEIRIRLVELQRDLGAEGDVIMEGRDITTVVFPNAEVKIYLTAEPEERAMRRYKELVAKGVETTFEETLESLNKRDYNDMHKEMGALKIAEGAEVVDSTNLSIEEVYEVVKNIIERKREN